MKGFIKGFGAGCAATALTVGAVSVYARQNNGWRPTILSVPSVSGSVRNNLTVRVRATTVNGTPVGAGRRVPFYVQTPTRSILVGYGYIGNDGYAATSFRPGDYAIPAGSYVFAADFPGDGTSSQALPAAPCTFSR